MHQNVGDFIFCFNKVPWKGVGIFTFAIKDDDSVSSKRRTNTTRETPVNIEGQIILDQHRSREIERKLINYFGSDTPVKIKGKFKDELTNDVEAWTLLIQIAHIIPQKQGDNEIISVKFLSALAARQRVESIDLSSC